MPPQTITDLGKKVKAKYPGEYDDLTDDEVGRKVKAKFPGDYDDFADISMSVPPGFKPQVGVPVVPVPSTLGAIKGNPMVQGIIGAGKEIGREGANIGHLLGMNKPAEEIPSLQMENTPQKVGSIAIKGLEFLLPGKWEKQAVELAPKAPMIARMLYNALSTGAVETAQSGSPKQGAIAGLTAGGITGVAEPFSQLLKRTGQKIELSTIRGSLANWRGGFDKKVLYELKLKGNLDQSFDQISGLLDTLRKERNSLIDPSVTVDIGKIFDQAEQGLMSQIKDLKLAGQGDATMAAFNRLKQDVMGVLPTKTVQTGTQQVQGSLGVLGGTRTVPITKQVPDTIVPLTKAEDAKEAIGLLGAWAYGRNELEASATEKASNALYPKLKEAILAAAPKGTKIAELNARMHEILPIRDAILTRIPVEARNRLFSLSDIAATLPAVIKGDVPALGLLGLTRLQKSLRFGNLLNRTDATPGLSNLSRILGGVSGGMVK